jgi:hypothetical protein
MTEFCQQGEAMLTRPRLIVAASVLVFVGSQIVLLGVVPGAEERHSPAPAGPSARRYVDHFEFDRHREDLLSDQFRLFSHPVVQAELKLSSVQVVCAEKTWRTPDKEVPNVVQLLSARKEQMARPNLTEQERKAISDESLRRCNDLRSEFLQQKLREFLDLKQRQRLDELLIQMRGPVLIAVDPRLTTSLRVPSNQLAAIKNVISETDKQIIPCLARFGRGFISGFEANETAADRDGEMKGLIADIERLLTSRDDQILQLLTEEQRQRWKVLQGTPLRIQWDPWEFLLEPFEKKE